MSMSGQLEKSKGSLLKEARQAQGIALETVHEATKIPMDVLKGIEEGYTVGTISPFYVKGFIKMYAKYLGIASREVLDEEPRPHLVVAEPIKNQGDIDKLQSKFKEFLTRQRQQQLVKLAALGIVLLVLTGFTKGVLAIVGHFQKSRGRQIQKVKTANSESAKTEKVKVQPAKPAATKVEKISESASKKARSFAPPVNETKVESKPEAAPPASSEAEPEFQSDKIHLTVKPRRKAWLQVKVDGNIIFQSILKEGAAESWEAEKEIEISGKDIQFLDFELNGKMVDLGKVDSNARRVVITPKGLTVRK